MYVGRNDRLTEHVTVGVERRRCEIFHLRLAYAVTVLQTYGVRYSHNHHLNAVTPLAVFRDVGTAEEHRPCAEFTFTIPEGMVSLSRHELIAEPRVEGVVSRQLKALHLPAVLVVVDQNVLNMPAVADVGRVSREKCHHLDINVYTDVEGVLAELTFDTCAQSGRRRLCNGNCLGRMLTLHVRTRGAHSVRKRSECVMSQNTITEVVSTFGEPVGVLVVKQAAFWQRRFVIGTH